MKFSKFKFEETLSAERLKRHIVPRTEVRSKSPRKSSHEIHRNLWIEDHSVLSSVGRETRLNSGYHFPDEVLPVIISEHLYFEIVNNTVKNCRHGTYYVGQDRLLFRRSSIMLPNASWKIFCLQCTSALSTIGCQPPLAQYDFYCLTICPPSQVNCNPAPHPTYCVIPTLLPFLSALFLPFLILHSHFSLPPGAFPSPSHDYGGSGGTIFGAESGAQTFTKFLQLKWHRQKL